MNIKYAFIGLLLLVGNAKITATAQSVANFYHRIDVASSNIYTFAISNLFTGYMNYWAKDMLFDNSYSYTFFDISDNGSDVKTKNNNLIGLLGKELFNDVTGGVKLGYVSDYPAVVNWCIFASAHYKVNQFRTSNGGDYMDQKIHRIMPGGGIQLTFGRVDQPVKVQVEGSCRYDFPCRYKGPAGSLSDALNEGLSSHFAIRIGGPAFLQGIGVYADFLHYDLFRGNNAYFNNPKSKMFNIGITYTLTPWKIEESY